MTVQRWAKSLNILMRKALSCLRIWIIGWVTSTSKSYSKESIQRDQKSELMRTIWMRVLNMIRKSIFKKYFFSTSKPEKSLGSASKTLSAYVTFPRRSRKPSQLQTSKFTYPYSVLTAASKIWCTNVLTSMKKQSIRTSQVKRRFWRNTLTTLPSKYSSISADKTPIVLPVSEFTCQSICYHQMLFFDSSVLRSWRSEMLRRK